MGDIVERLIFDVDQADPETFAENPPEWAKDTFNQDCADKCIGIIMKVDLAMINVMII